MSDERMKLVEEARAWLASELPGGRDLVRRLADALEESERERVALLNGIEHLHLDLSLTGDEKAGPIMDALAVPLRKHGRLPDDGLTARAERADVESRKLDA